MPLAERLDAHPAKAHARDFTLGVKEDEDFKVSLGSGAAETRSRAETLVLTPVLITGSSIISVLF